MIIIYNGGVVGTPNATKKGLHALLSTMHYATDKWKKEGMPLSNQEM